MSGDSGGDAPRAFPQFNRLKQCRHGMMLYNARDAYIGRSLEEYGEFSEGEIDVFRQFVGPGCVALDVGANIGTHVVWLAQAVGPAGWVLAFEPQRVVFQTLCGNVALNSLTNVQCFCAAVGGAPGQIVVPQLDYSQPNNYGGLGLGRFQQGEPTPVIHVDGLKLKRCDFIKIDVEGMEEEVLKGAAQTIARLSPILYVENDRTDQSAALIRYIDSLGYRLYWHLPPLYNPRNFAGNSVDVFGAVVSRNMLCLPRSDSRQAKGLAPVEIPPAAGGASPPKPMR